MYTKNQGAKKDTTPIRRGKYPPLNVPKKRFPIQYKT